MSEDSPEEIPLERLQGMVPEDETVIPNASASRERRPFFSNNGGRSAPSKTVRKPAVPKVRPGYFVEPLTQFYGAFGLAVMPFDPVCANALLMNAPKAAESLDNWAQQNDTVRRTLFAITSSTAVGMVIVAHFPIALAIMIHHVPAAQNYLGAMGQEMAETIAKQMNADGPPNDSTET